MEIRFAHRELESRFVSVAEGTRAWGEVVARAYRKRLTLLSVLESSLELRQHRGLRLHALKGEFSGKHAIDLAGRWRLIVSIQGDTLTVEEVSNHYGD
ncbi:MAG: type II toxin-antitoxin system RelE/ParE family toxin [Dehalococcoidia bacterium]